MKRLHRSIYCFVVIAALAALLSIGCGGGGSSGGDVGSSGGGSGSGGDGGSSSTATPNPTATATGDPAIIAMENQVKTLVDNQRALYGKPALTWNETLRTVARNHSQDMITRNFFSHTNPDGLDPGDRVTKAGITYSAVAENIAQNMGYADPGQQAVDGWMNSEGHRNNILDASNYGFTQTGVGIAKKSDGTYYFTQVFIKPR